MNTDLAARIADRSACLGVIGLGHVGVPLAAILAARGFHVIGVDRDLRRVDFVAAGRSPFTDREPGLSELLGRAGSKLRATTSFGALEDADVVLICVDTPVDEMHRPSLDSLTSACRSLAAEVRPGTLVVVESTIPPGTMSGIVEPIFADRQVLLGHCPERVMPGRLLLNIRTMNRVLGGAGPALGAMRALYAQFVEGDLDDADVLTAELVKTAENAYRDVNIAFANQLALISEIAGADVWQVRGLVRKSPGREVLMPGPGVGGHCIPKDPWLLAAPLGREAEASLLGAARRLNDGMTQHVAALVKKLTEGAEGRRVAILGYSYLEESDDVRNSPSVALEALLAAQGFEVGVHDPFVRDRGGDPLDVIRGADCAVLMVGHDAYRSLDLRAAARLMRTACLLDCRGFFERESLRATGFRFHVLGVGTREV